MFKTLALFSVVLLYGSFVWADDDSSFSNYESIVNELKTSATDTPIDIRATDYDWEEVAIHAGVAVAGSWVSMTPQNDQSASGIMKGVELNLGINLFSRSIRAEGAYLNFAQEDMNSHLRADLKEIELRLVYTSSLNQDLSIRLGSGLGARYLNVNSYADNHWTSYQYTSPASVFLVGFEQKISKIVTIGPEISYRASIGSDTFDKSSVDGALRLNATF